MTKTCLGCGVKLQTKDASKVGYIKEEVLAKGYCMRCYRLTHYHDLVNVDTKVNNQIILNKIAKKQGFCFFICDIMNFNREALDYYKSINMPKIFVVSKEDIIPQEISHQKIIDWLKNKEQIKEEIIFTSQKRKTGINTILEKIAKISFPIYFLGMTNTGKSSLLNELFENLNLTVSEIPNTTLDFSKISVNPIIYDTVGLTYKYQYDLDLLKEITVKKPIKSITMPLKANAGIILNNIGRIITDKENSITCFFSNKLKPQKIYANNLLYLNEKPLIINVLKETNVIIKGVGFFYVKKPCTLKVYHVPKEMLDILPSFLRRD